MPNKKQSALDQRLENSVQKLSLCLTLVAVFLTTSCANSPPRIQYVPKPEIRKVDCPTTRAKVIDPPDSPEDGYIKYKHHELALEYNELADMNDAKAACIEKHNELATQPEL